MRLAKINSGGVLRVLSNVAAVTRIGVKLFENRVQAQRNGLDSPPGPAVDACKNIALSLLHKGSFATRRRSINEDGWIAVWWQAKKGIVHKTKHTLESKHVDPVGGHWWPWLLNYQWCSVHPRTRTASGAAIAHQCDKQHSP
jgi:hypothetical protein